jgi:hypothetical protein
LKIVFLKSRQFLFLDSKNLASIWKSVSKCQMLSWSMKSANSLKKLNFGIPQSFFSRPQQFLWALLNSVFCISNAGTESAANSATWKELCKTEKLWEAQKMQKNKKWKEQQKCTNARQNTGIQEALEWGTLNKIFVVPKKSFKLEHFWVSRFAF